jgi:phytoene dehydrogenase-like protein
MKSRYDVVILGAGHNGLVAASYIGRAGLSVLLLEKNDYIGGATTSQRVFPDYEARISRYSYLVSLFPEKIIRDLGLNLELRRRATGSFTPYIKNGAHDGLLISNADEALSRRSIVDLTGSQTEFDQLRKFYNLSRLFAEHTWDSMLEPLVSRAQMKRRFDTDDLSRESWRSLAEEPLGHSLERYLKDDLVRGLVFTDAKVGVLTHPHDPSLLQNRCFLYHLIGNKTGEWKVPVGGMGAVAGELENCARKAGADFLLSVDLVAVDLEKPGVDFEIDGKQRSIDARFLLVNFGHNVLAKYSGRRYRPDPEDEGSVFKINMLLRRLPKLKAKKYPSEQAWCGTFHSDEGYEQMKTSYGQAADKHLPDKTPCEVYCHTLTDETILSPELRKKGFHTITLFGLDAPYSLFTKHPPSLDSGVTGNEAMRQQAQKRFLASMNQWLDEPLEDCLAIARDGSLCIESKSPVDIENSLGMYHGNIFQNAPTWPFASNNEQIGTWGVETEWQNVFLCGSSALRGGAVSGIPGHNAAKKILQVLQKTSNGHRRTGGKHPPSNVKVGAAR